MSRHQTYSLDQIKDMLLAQLDSVVHHYAPPSSDSYTHHGEYWTLNPGRADTRVGSFRVRMQGARAGSWNDYAVDNCRGDILDLIDLSINGVGRSDLGAAMKEARAFLGLETLNPAERRQREERAEEAKARRREKEAEERRKRDKRERAARAIYASAQEGIRATPVESYLRDTRGIDLARLGRQPRAIRFAPELSYYHEDEQTGEIFEGTWPAMVAAINGPDGKMLGIHRTWLELRDGRWQKASVPQPKKVLGTYWGCSINMWRGIGPQGGKPAPLSQCQPGTHVFIAEGIEDALSVVMLLPEERVLCAVSLSNMGAVRLPENVSTVTLVADRDENESARDTLARAVQAHQGKGREVRVFFNQWGGKDLNDALRGMADGTNEEPETTD
ncbi:MAG: hypothetical protein GYB50_20615 [Rhodobacteraceae bacterium]|nr:hypothetical protein [Paracoccaceae bacterium]